MDLLNEQNILSDSTDVELSKPLNDSISQIKESLSDDANDTNVINQRTLNISEDDVNIVTTAQELESVSHNYISNAIETYLNDQQQQQLPTPRNPIGIDDLPLFASPEARRIDIENKQKEAKLEQLLNKIADLDERIKVMSEHYKNVEQEVEYTNSLLNAKTAEINTEKHLNELVSREISRSKIDKKKLQQSLDTLQDEIHTLQKKLNTSKQNMEEYKLKMNWNQEELQNYILQEKQKEEDNINIEKYKRIDDMKIKETIIQIEKLTNELLLLKERESDKQSELYIKQTEVRRLAEDCNILQKERQSLIELWEKSIQETKRRDIEINQLGEQYATIKTDKIKKDEMIRIQKRRLLEQEKENIETEQQIETLQRIISRQREDLNNKEMKLKEIKNELMSLKNELISTSDKINMKKMDIKNKIQANEDKKIKLEREKQQYQNMKTLLEDTNNTNMSIENKIKKWENEINSQQKDYEIKLIQVNNYKENIFKETQICYDIKQELTRITLEINGNKNITKNYESQMIQLDKEMMRQEELIYNAEYQIQQIERKIARGLGERTNEEKQILNEQMVMLETRHNEIKEQKKALSTQLRKLTIEYTTNQTRKEELNNENNILTNKLNEVELENKMLEEQIKKQKKEKNESYIQNDVLKLDIKKLKDILSSKIQTVYSLQYKKQQLLIDMETTKQNLYSERDIIKAEIKLLNDTKHKLIIELKNKESITNNLKARFEILSKAKEDGQSQAQLVIETAQKREELRRKGDELDIEIQKNEKEILALQLTLDHLNERNNNFKTSLRSLDEKAEEIQKMKNIESMVTITRDDVFRIKKQLQRLNNDIVEEKSRLDIYQQYIYQNIQKTQLYEMNILQVDDDIKLSYQQIDELKNKIMKKIVKVSKEYQEKSGNTVSSSNSNHNNDTNESSPTTDTIMAVHESTFTNTATTTTNTTHMNNMIEKLIQLDLIQDISVHAVFTLVQLAAEFPDIAEDLDTLLREQAIKIPTRSPLIRDIYTRPNRSAGGGGGSGGPPNTSGSTRNGLPPSSSDSKFSFNLRAKTMSNKLGTNIHLSSTAPLPPRSSASERSIEGVMRSSTASSTNGGNANVLKTKSFVPEFN